MENSKLGTAVLIKALTSISSGSSEGSGNTYVTEQADMNVTTLVVVSTVAVPQSSSMGKYNASKARITPFCAPDVRFPPIFTPCQSKNTPENKIMAGFTLVPPLKKFSYKNKTTARAGNHKGWPWYNWMLINDAGATADISALSNLFGSKHVLWNVSATRNVSESSIRFLPMKTHKQLANASLFPAPVCVQPPFLFLLANITTNTTTLECTSSSVTCYLAECWNGSFSLALLVKLPTFIPIPVKTDPDKFPLMKLVRNKRDFGITALVIGAIIFSAGAATTAAVAMAQQVQTAEAINNVVSKISYALEMQERINRHLAFIC